MFCFCFEAAMK